MRGTKGKEETSKSFEKEAQKNVIYTEGKQDGGW